MSKNSLAMRTAYSNPFPFVATCSGDKFRPEYCDCLDEQNVPSVKVVNQFDQDAMIQASLDSVLVYNILERATADPSLLEKVKSHYLNLLDAPQSLAESLQRTMDMNDSFAKLPSAVKSLFDNNMLTMISEINSGEAEKKISELYKNSGKFDVKSDIKESVDNGE